MTKKLDAKDIQGLYKLLKRLEADVDVKPHPTKSWILAREEVRALKIVLSAIRDCF